MKKIVPLLLAIVTVLSLCACRESSKPFQVGFAQADITPEGKVLLGGFGDDSTRLSNDVLDPIYATCVAFTDYKDNTVLMFCMDLLYIDGSVFNFVRNQISEATGIPFANILFTASHTHSAPVQNEKQNKQHNTQMEQACLEIAKQALEDRKPAKMFATFARPDGLNFVRHYVLADGSYLGKRIGTIATENLVGHVHKADNLMQLIKFERDGGKDVILTNWQAHYKGADSVNYYGVSADYPGIYRTALEEQLDCHVAFVLGGSGNLNSYSKIPGKTTTSGYINHGERLAEVAAEAASGFQPVNTGKIHVTENIFNLDGVYLPLYTFGFGDFACAFAPFEIFDTTAKAVREDSMWKYTFFASCAFGSTGNGYLPDADGFTYRTYEAYGQGVEDTKYTNFPEGTAEIIQEQLTSMLNDSFKDSGLKKKDKDPGYISEPFAPVTDGVEYTNPTPGDATLITEGTGDRGLYCLQLETPDGIKNMLAASKEIADQIVSKTTMKLLFDERDVIVGFAE